MQEWLLLRGLVGRRLGGPDETNCSQKNPEKHEQYSSNISPKALRKAADIQEKILKLNEEIASILSAADSTETPSPRRKMSSSARRRIAAAQRARWARVKAQRSGGSEAQETPKRKMSPAVRARIAAAQKARWAKIHARTSKPAKAPTRKMSAAGRKRISEAAKARWAAVRAKKVSLKAKSTAKEESSAESR